LGVEAYNDNIDCLRSGLDGADCCGPVLEGLAGCAPPPPMKSKPSKESPALVCFGGAGSDFSGTVLVLGGPVLGRGGADIGSSPKRSTGGCGFGSARGGWLELLARRCDAERSICTFSCTFFNGCTVLLAYISRMSPRDRSPYHRRIRPAWTDLAILLPQPSAWIRIWCG
jgi:hypothetical protein